MDSGIVLEAVIKSQDPYIPPIAYESEAEVYSALSRVSSLDPRLEAIYERREEYPLFVLSGLANNLELTDYVYGYLDARPNKKPPKFTQAELDASHPLLLQWDSRWAYDTYGDSTVAAAGCGPVCLSMVILSLTGDASATPTEICRFSEENGHYVADNGTSWTLMAAAGEEYGLRVETVPLWEPHIKSALDNGGMVICVVGPGNFTTFGHYIVIYGYNDDGFLINDPNSISRSNVTWRYDDIKGQIDNIWAFYK